MQAAKNGAVNFLKHLERDDEIHAWTFNGRIGELGPGGRAGVVGEALSGRIRGLFADGGTALYDATTLALRTAEARRRQEKTPRLYAVVLLTDGCDTSSRATKTDVLSLLPQSEQAEGTRVFAIGYGKEADKNTLQTISEASNGRMFAGGTEDVEKIYNAIAAYF